MPVLAAESRNFVPQFVSREPAKRCSRAIVADQAFPTVCGPSGFPRRAVFYFCLFFLGACAACFRLSLYLPKGLSGS